MSRLRYARTAARPSVTPDVLPGGRIHGPYLLLTPHSVIHRVCGNDPKHPYSSVRLATDSPEAVKAFLRAARARRLRSVAPRAEYTGTGIPHAGDELGSMISLRIGENGFEPGWGCGDNNCAQFHPDQDGGNATKHDVNQVACYMQGRLDSNGSPDCTAAIGRSLGQPPVFELQTVQAETENCTTASSQPSCVPATHTCSADRTNSDVFLAQRFFPYYGDADAGNVTGGGSVGEKKAGVGVTTRHERPH